MSRDNRVIGFDTANMYFDRQGNRLTWIEYAARHADQDYNRVAEAFLPGRVWISTVWLGMDHNYGFPGGKRIFETMVFAPGDSRDNECERYGTEREAREGHLRMVRVWRKRQRWWRRLARCVGRALSR